MNKKKILAAKAIAALLLASTLPMSAEAASNLDMKDVHSARGGCGASARGGCGAAPEQTPAQNAPKLPNQAPSGAPTNQNTPPKSSCAAQYNSPARPTSSCAAQYNGPARPTASCAAQPRQSRPTSSCAAQYNGPARPTSSCAAASPDSSMAPHAPSQNQMYRNRQQQMQHQQGTTSTYQGTTTGPGPNGGYPETPRGTYNIEQGKRN